MSTTNLPADQQLKKAVNDARATAFRELGLSATLAENLPQLAFNRAWQRFLNELQQPGDIAAFFFAGHGRSRQARSRHDRRGSVLRVPRGPVPGVA
jgi:hypothetical protein